MRAMTTLDAFDGVESRLEKPRGRKRHACDAYRTPIDVVRQGVEWFRGRGYDSFPSRTSAIEPGCGGDAPFLAAIRSRFRIGALIGVELQGPSVEAVTHCGAEPRPYTMIYRGTDYLTWTPTHDFVLAATNPPFALAEAFVRKTASILTFSGVALFLMRLEMLASQGRYKLWKEDVALFHIGVLSQRVSFTGDGKTDRTEYAWYVFGNRTGKTNVKPQVDWLPPLKA